MKPDRETVDFAKIERQKVEKKRAFGFRGD